MNCTFVNNSAGANGGAICGGDAVNCTFEGNYALSGGAMYNEYKSKAIKCIFIDNKASFGKDVYGNITKQDCKFKYIRIKAENITGYYGNSLVFYVIITNDYVVVPNVNVKISVNGKNYTIKTDNVGWAGIDLNLPVGNYNVTSSYDKVSITSRISVKSTMAVNDVIGEYLKTKVNAIVDEDYLIPDLKIDFKVGNVVYPAKIVDGVATANIDLDAGNYTVTTINTVNNEQKQFNLVINKASSAVSLAAAQSNGVSTLTAILTPASATDNVILSINGENKTAAIKSGKATLTLDDLVPGNYTAIASYNGDNNLMCPKITAKAKTFKKSVKTKKYTVKLNVNQKVKVAVKVNKKTYYAYTNAKGQATFKITKLTKKGKYTATVSSTANKCYNKAKSVNVKITIK
ncbi:Ig-like domain-containing protein [uncultured Methanobrevibacter sp.]|uniref:Ig-like domain-containing protein n=1 Tax=uncultured Methanobrevibacter sp. TaxID=253161 RepID=UPI00260E9E0E|nr:Ig-like domain-containing protein [uncultured Methanobrevibacter sp.]